MWWAFSSKNLNLYIIYRVNVFVILLFSKISNNRDIQSRKNYHKMTNPYRLSNLWPFRTHRIARSFSKKSHFGNPIFMNFVKSWFSKNPKNSKKIRHKMLNHVYLHVIANFWSIHTHIQARSFSKKITFWKPPFYGMLQNQHFWKFWWFWKMQNSNRPLGDPKMGVKSWKFR